MVSERALTLALTLLLQLAPTSDAFLLSMAKRWSFRPLNLLGDRPDRESEVRRKLEFKDLEPLEETEARRKRIEHDMENRARFERFGDSLWDLRSEMEKLSHRLIDAIEEGHDHIQESTRRKLRDAESRDPELSYMLAVAEFELAEKQGRFEDAVEHKARAAAARSCLPQFNLDGLWVGKYGSKYDLINITYVGDTLIAEKVTGENNVPKGAITFQVDLHPLRQQMTSKEVLQPIMLTEKAAQKWGTRKLPRYAGLGQVAEAKFKNNQWMDGQLIIIGDEYFSFAWLPIEQQIFFGRPSPDLALKMLRDSGVSCVPTRAFSHPPSLDEDVQVQKVFVTRCLELSHDHEDEIDGNAFGGIWHCGDDTEECYFE
jgi:Cyclin D1 binding domain